VTELLVKYADPSISRDKLLEELRSDASDFIVAYHLLYDAKKNPYYAYDEASVDPIESEVQNLREGIINFQLGDEGDDDDVDALLLHVSPTKDLPGLKDRKKMDLRIPNAHESRGHHAGNLPGTCSLRIRMEGDGALPITLFDESARGFGENYDPTL